MVEGSILASSYIVKPVFFPLMPTGYIAYTAKVEQNRTVPKKSCLQSAPKVAACPPKATSLVRKSHMTLCCTFGWPDVVQNASLER